MKDIKNYLVNENISASQGYFCSDDLKGGQYILVWPYGMIEMFSESELNKRIKELQDILDNEEEDIDTGEVEEDLGTYEELLDIQPSVWASLSGPGRKDGVIQGCVGFKFKKAK